MRGAIFFDIELNNPTKEPQTYEVAIEGEGLIGDGTFSLLPN